MSLCDIIPKKQLGAACAAMIEGHIKGFLPSDDLELLYNSASSSKHMAGQHYAYMATEMTKRGTDDHKAWITRPGPGKLDLVYNLNNLRNHMKTKFSLKSILSAMSV